MFQIKKLRLFGADSKIKLKEESTKKEGRLAPLWEGNTELNKLSKIKID